MYSVEPVGRVMIHDRHPAFRAIVLSLSSLSHACCARSTRVGTPTTVTCRSNRVTLTGWSRIASQYKPAEGPDTWQK
jgi:hypothetical protein